MSWKASWKASECTSVGLGRQGEHISVPKVKTLFSNTEPSPASSFMVWISLKSGQLHPAIQSSEFPLPPPALEFPRCPVGLLRADSFDYQNTWHLAHHRLSHPQRGWPRCYGATIPAAHWTDSVKTWGSGSHPGQVSKLDREVTGKEGFTGFLWSAWGLTNVTWVLSKRIGPTNHTYPRGARIEQGYVGRDLDDVTLLSLHFLSWACVGKPPPALNILLEHCLLHCGWSKKNWRAEDRYTYPTSVTFLKIQE